MNLQPNNSDFKIKIEKDYEENVNYKNNDDTSEEIYHITEFSTKIELYNDKERDNQIELNNIVLRDTPKKNKKRKKVDKIVVDYKKNKDENYNNENDDYDKNKNYNNENDDDYDVNNTEFDDYDESSDKFDDSSSDDDYIDDNIYSDDNDDDDYIDDDCDDIDSDDIDNNDNDDDDFCSSTKKKIKIEKNDSDNIKEVSFQKKIDKDSIVAKQKTINSRWTYIVVKGKTTKNKIYDNGIIECSNGK